MTLGSLALAYARQGGPAAHIRNIWRLIAWLGRYGHQPANVLLALPFVDISHLADGVAEILRGEKDMSEDMNNA